MKGSMSAAVCITTILLSGASPGPAAEGAAQNVDVVRPQRGRIARALDLPASVEAFEQADLYAKVSGYVNEVKADLGDTVKAGQLLATLDVPEYAKDLLEAKAQQAAKVAAAKAAQASVAAAESGIKAADAHIQQAQAASKVAQKQVERYRADAQLKETTAKRKEALYKDKVITDQELDDFRTQWEIAKADVGTAEVKQLAAEADIAAAQSGRDVAVSQKDVAIAQQISAAALVDVASAQIEKVNTLAEYTRIVAPFNGTITRRTIDRGALVQAATATRTMPVFSLQRIDKVRVFVDAPETELAFLTIDGPAKVKPYGAATVLGGKITRTSNSLNSATRTMRVEIDLDNAAGKILPGMYVQVIFEVDARENVLTVPKAALLAQGTDRVIYIVRDGHAVRTVVKPGIDDGARVEIREGITEDDAVLLNAKTAPSANAAVNPVVKGGK